MTVSTVTVTVGMPTSVQMLSTGARLSCDPFGAAFCDGELLAALAAAVADAFVEDAAAFGAPGTRQEDKGRGGKGPWLVGTSENILRRRTHSAVYGCFVLHVCTVAARVLPAARVHHEKHTRQVFHSACACALCRHATSDKHTCWPRTACSCSSVCGVSYCFVLYAL